MQSSYVLESDWIWAIPSAASDIIGDALDLLESLEGPDPEAPPEGRPPSPGFGSPRTPRRKKSKHKKSSPLQPTRKNSKTEIPIQPIRKNSKTDTEGKTLGRRPESPGFTRKSALTRENSAPDLSKRNDRLAPKRKISAPPRVPSPSHGTELEVIQES
eukprot:CAMPEP_0116861144 /NCGR_PEP_ID=MMETSP0418-20121206/22861_1 /TAXON_ID=1158023 /ORGANISM="Astrosyne radiata, Strain 13vi08-1A" /LENGTH=157 /DNA_ID=CAMNT_0004495737 /DNA_START=292 /DNA_END=764 /DNA_ORIENTATION=-